MDEREGSKERRDKHVASIDAILHRESLTLTPDNVVNLLAYLQASKVFQELAIRAIASTAAGKTDWDALDGMLGNVELSDKLLERLIQKLSQGTKTDE